MEPEVTLSEHALPEHVAENRRFWDATADRWVASGERCWADAVPSWGIWSIPDPEVTLLPADMTGLDAIELGCGTAYVSAWMARRGARVTGIDNSSAQLATAQRLAAEHGVELTLIHGSAEMVRFPDGSFDFAVSEYGAAIWCDPYVWIPEAHRLLRPGGQLTFLGGTPLAMICVPVDGSGACLRQLQRDYFGLHRIDWRDAVEDPGGIEFNLPISKWFELFRTTGFEVLDYNEIQAPGSAADSPFSVSADWAQRFPSEHVWKLRKR